MNVKLGDEYYQVNGAWYRDNGYAPHVYDFMPSTQPGTSKLATRVGRTRRERAKLAKRLQRRAERDSR